MSLLATVFDVPLSVMAPPFRRFPTAAMSFDPAANVNAGTIRFPVRAA